MKGVERVMMQIIQQDKLEHSITNSNFFRLKQLYIEFIAYTQTNKATKQVYTRQLKQFFNYLGINGIAEPTRKDLQAYLIHLENKGLKPTTIQNYLVALKQFYNFLEVNYNVQNVAKGLKSPRVSRLHKKDNLSMEQLKNILMDIDISTEQGARDKAIILLMVTGALRTIEVNRAKIEDIRYLNGKCMLFIQGKGHTEKDTPIELSEPVKQAIDYYFTFRDAKSLRSSEPLFTSTSNNSKGKAITTRTISTLVKDRYKNVNINSSRLTAHSLRHTGITEAYKEMKRTGTQDVLHEVQRYARHQNPVTTQIYLHEVEQQENIGAKLVSNKIANMLVS